MPEPPTATVLMALLLSIAGPGYAAQDAASFDATRINTPGTEDMPGISGDGRTLTFLYGAVDFVAFNREQDVRRKLLLLDTFIPGAGGRPGFSDEEWFGGEAAQGKIRFYNYFSMRDDEGRWSAPEPIPFENLHRTRGTFAGASMTADGTCLAAIAFGLPGTRGESDICFSEKRPDGRWSFPRLLGQEINSDHKEDDVRLSSNGRFLVFDLEGFEGDLERTHAAGLLDIWIAEHNDDGTWGTAAPLPEPVNSPLVEKFPWIGPEGDRICFVRADPRQAPPRLHIHLSRKREDGSWSEPEPIDVGVEFVAAPTMTDDGRFLYFESYDDRFAHPNYGIFVSERREDGTWSRARPVD